MFYFVGYISYLPVFHGFILDHQERLEGKKKGEVEKISDPHVSRKDMEMAEKVNKYNVSSVT